ncbi:MAG: arylsulfatase [Bacteroidota bacterium]
MNQLLYASILLLFLSGLIGCQPADSTDSSSSPSVPNIVLILADDMGYGDIQQYNPASTIPTPHLNQLCQEGMMFRDAHTPSSVCTPTRYGLLTGRYSWRSRLKKFVLSGYSPHLIEKDRQTIASLLQSQGYETAVVGKWHLGLDWAWDENGFPEKGDQLGFVPEPDAIDYSQAVTAGPVQNGFDYSYVIPASLDIPPYVYLENNQVVGIPDSIYPGSTFPYFIRRGETGAGFEFDKTLYHLTEKAMGFIEEQSRTEQPFFLYMPLTGPHKPALPHADFAGKSGLGPYADLVMEVDASVGKIMSTLKERGLSENTLVIYTSDNGSYMYRYEDQEVDHVTDNSKQGYVAKNHKANKDWRGTKADIWEAGHRVPFIVRYPGMIEAGSTQDQTICLTDVLSSVCELVGMEYDAGQSEDSYSFLPVLTGGSMNRPPVVHHSVAGMFSLRKDNWKMIFGNGSGGRQQPRGELWGKPYQLFNLEADPEENQDLYQTSAADVIMADMTKKLIRILEQSEGHGVDLEGI